MSAARKGALACVVAAAANGAIVPECKNALDERLSGLGQIVDGDTVIDCQTLSSRGLCRFAGHLCDAACDRCGDRYLRYRVSDDAWREAVPEREQHASLCMACYLGEPRRERRRALLVAGLVAALVAALRSALACFRSSD